MLSKDFLEPSGFHFGLLEHALIHGIVSIDVDDIRYLFLAWPPYSTFGLAIILGTPTTIQEDAR
jgi:hypothetical protein